MLQCAAAFCSVPEELGWKRSLDCCSVLQCAACCSVLQRVAACCNMLQCVAACCKILQCVAACCKILQCAAMCCSVLQCVAVCCSVLQCTRGKEAKEKLRLGHLRHVVTISQVVRVHDYSGVCAHWIRGAVIYAVQPRSVE